MDLSITDAGAILIKVTLTLVVLVLTAVCLYTSWCHSYWKKRGVTYDRPAPIVGSLTFLMRKSFFDYFYEVSQKFPEDYVGIYTGHKPALVIQSPELARNVLVRDADHFEDRFAYASKSDPMGCYNLFSVKNPIWSMMRRECSQMFTSSRLRKLAELMNGNAKELVDRIQREHVEGNKPIAIKELFLMYTSDTVAYTVFGLRTSVLSGEGSPLWLITSTMVTWTFRRGLELTLVFFWPIMAKLLRLKFFSVAATEYIRKLFWNVVESRQKSGNYNEKDLVNLLLKIKENAQLSDIDDPELLDNLMLAQAAIFIFGSVDTSSITLSCCLHELAYHPEEQEKMFYEVNKAIKKSGKEMLGYDELLELKYLASCVQETQRKYPPVPNLDRVCAKDYKLTDSLTIEAGTPVYVNLLALHRNEKYYPEPMQWRPDRFTGLGDNRQFTFLPFGEGPRFCIGKRYGMLQVWAALALLVHKYRVVPAPDSEYVIQTDPYAVLLSPKGLRINFIPRK